MINNSFFRTAPLVTLLLIGGLTAYGQKEYSINAIQGDKNMSPLEGQAVQTTGIVTAITRTGFFIQTPDDSTDKDPKTSEGVFVFTKDQPSDDAAVGNLVRITGKVEEYRPRQEPASLPVTEISMRSGSDSIVVLKKGVELPKPIILTLGDIRSNKIDEFEKYEGMRVVVTEMTVVAPTGGKVDEANNRSDSNGVFFGVIKGTPKPFREPGYDIYEYAFMTDKERSEFKRSYPSIRFFDDNPETLRVDSQAQLGSKPIDIPARTLLRNVVGVMNYSFRKYTILTDTSTRPSVAGYEKEPDIPVAGPREFTVAGMNIERFFDENDDPRTKDPIISSTAVEQRLKKISLAIRTVLRSPDVIGVEEAENLSILKRLAAKINADTVASGKPDPQYTAYLEEGNDIGGIDSGFLVKASRVKVLDVKQFYKDETFDANGGSKEAFLFDRPPLVLRASINDPKNDVPFEFTVIVNHLKSFLGYNDPKRQDAVRTKKRLQAEMMAKLIQKRQKADPKERVIMIGDFNAYQFNDGIVDVIGTIKGTPAAKGEVINPSDAVVDPHMTDIVELAEPSQQYSYNYDGNGQILDHFIVTENALPFVSNFAFARVNADFPESFRSDDTRAERYSDHDAAVGYFSFDAVRATGKAVGAAKVQ